MLQQLETFLNELQVKRVDILNQNVDAIVEEKVRALAEKIKSEVITEIETEASVLEIKIEAITDAIKVVRANAVVEETTAETPVTDDTQY